MKKILLGLSVCLLLLLVTQTVFAVELTNPLQSNGKEVSSFGELLKTIGDWLIEIGIPIAGLMIVVGGFQIMVSGGQPERVKRGRATILWTVVGYAILIVGWSIVGIINNLIGGA